MGKLLLFIIIIIFILIEQFEKINVEIKLWFRIHLAHEYV